MKLPDCILALIKIIFVLIFAIPLFAHANTSLNHEIVNLRFKKLSINEGLSQSTIYCMLQDKYGFIWFGTENGLNKFDGYNFTIFQNIAKDETSLASNRILSLYEDHTGNLWIGTIGGGLSKFDREKETFTHYKHNPENPSSISNDRVMCIYEDHTGILWLGTAGGGLNRFDIKTQTFRSYRPEIANPHSITSSVVRAITEDKTGMLWIGTDGGGLCEFDPETGLFSSMKNMPGNLNSIPSNSIRSLLVDKFGKLWIGTTDGLAVYNLNSGKITNYFTDPDNKNSLSDNYIYHIYEDKAGRIWIGTNNGLDVFYPNLNIFHHYKNDPTDIYSLSNNIVRSIMQDKSGLYWVGTFRGGLNEFEYDLLKFAHFRASSRFPNSLSHSVVSAILEDHSGNLWIGTWGGGINVYNKDRTSMRVLKNNPANTNSLSNDIITSFAEDKNKNIWIGTYYGGLNKYNPVSGKFTRFSESKSKGLNNNLVMAVFVDSANNIWISTFGGGLNVLDQKTNQFSYYQPDELSTNSISSNRVWPIIEDKEGHLWIGTDGSGLEKFDRKTQTFYNFHYEPDNPNSLSHDVIITLLCDREGIIWIGTDGGGLNRFDPSTGIFKAYRVSNGLPNDVVTGILQDSNGQLWISTHKGLSRFDPYLERFTNFSTGDGLQSNEFNEGSGFYSPTGWMYFGGVNGFNAFIPEKVKQNPYIAPVVITDFKLFYQKVDINENSPIKKHINFTREIELKHSQDVITIEYAALSYINPEKSQYKYKLEGFDKNWIEAGNRRSVTYTNLNPKQYQFKVIACSADGIWNNEGTILKIDVVPPFWYTNWFIGSFATLLLVSVFLFIRNRERKLKKDKKKLEELINDRTIEIQNQKEELEKANVEIRQSSLLKEMFLANTSHEIRTPLNVINGFTNLLLNTPLDEKQKNYLDNIKNSSNNLNVLINDILDFSKIEAGKLSLEEFDFNFREVIHSLISSNSIKANEKRLNFNYHIDNQIPAFVKGDPLRLHQILLNLVQNAIKFTDESGSVDIAIDLANQTGDWVELNFIITDTGIGIPQEKLETIFDSFTQISNQTTRIYGGTGLGLSIVKRLVDLHNGSISVSSHQGRGSVFTVNLRFKKSGSVNEKDKESSYRIRKDSNQSKLNLLLVEDNEINIALARDTILLYNSNIKIDEARNGLEALEKVRSKDYDIIIMDIQMPEMDGYEATRNIRQFKGKNKNVPILGMSAHAMREEREKCFTVGMDDYITKPFVPEKLFSKIEKLTKTGHNSLIPQDNENEPQKNLKSGLKVIDLTLLNSTYKNDNLKIVRILQLYLKNIPVQLKDLSNNNKSKINQNTRVSAHSLKTSFNYIGLNPARDLCKKIENECISNEPNLNFDDAIDQIIAYWTIAEDEIRQYLANNNSTKP